MNAAVHDFRVRSRPREQGAALVIGLILLLILTLLAVAGMNTASTELVMAGNEQYRRNATLAASAGVERAISRIGTVSTSPGAPPVEVPATAMEGSETDLYASSTRYVGVERGLPQSSTDKFVGLHYVIDSTGTSARNARDRQVQGVFVVAGPGVGETTFGQVGSGLP